MATPGRFGYAQGHGRVATRTAASVGGVGSSLSAAAAAATAAAGAASVAAGGNKRSQIPHLQGFAAEAEQEEVDQEQEEEDQAGQYEDEEDEYYDDDEEEEVEQDQEDADVLEQEDLMGGSGQPRRQLFSDSTNLLGLSGTHASMASAATLAEDDPLFLAQQLLESQDANLQEIGRLRELFQKGTAWTSKTISLGNVPGGAVSVASGSENSPDGKPETIADSLLQRQRDVQAKIEAKRQQQLAAELQEMKQTPSINRRSRQLAARSHHGASIAERSEEHLKVVAAKQEQLRQALQEAEVAEVTAKPVITKDAQRKVRSVDMMLKWEQQRQAKLEQQRQLQKKLEAEALKPKPSISKRSAKIAQKAPDKDVPVGERLYARAEEYQIHKAVLAKELDAAQRKGPKLSAHSANLQRKGDVVERLHALAQAQAAKRAAQQQMREAAQEMGIDPVTGEKLFQPKINRKSAAIARRGDADSVVSEGRAQPPMPSEPERPVAAAQRGRPTEPLQVLPPPLPAGWYQSRSPRDFHGSSTQPPSPHNRVGTAAGSRQQRTPRSVSPVSPTSRAGAGASPYAPPDSAPPPLPAAPTSYVERPPMPITMPSPKLGMAAAPQYQLPQSGGGRGGGMAARGIPAASASSKWIEFVTSDGCAYYFNEDTMETRWAAPPEGYQSSNAAFLPNTPALIAATMAAIPGGAAAPPAGQRSTGPVSRPPNIPKPAPVAAAPPKPPTQRLVASVEMAVSDQADDRHGYSTQRPPAAVSRTHSGRSQASSSGSEFGGGGGGGDMDDDLFVEQSGRAFLQRMKARGSSLLVNPY